MTYDETENFYVSRDYNSGNRTPVQVFVKGMPVDANYLASLIRRNRVGRNIFKR